jgi:hypothetical protein
MDGPPALIAFDPLDAGPSVGFLASVTISATTSASAMTALPGTTGISGAGLPQENVCFYKQIQIANLTAGWVFVNFGQSGTAVATVASSYPVAPGAVVVVTAGGLQTYASVICAAGSAGGSVIFTRGQGL